MLSLHTSGPGFSLLFLFLCFQQCCSKADTSVQCKIINMEYVECLWYPNTTTNNYTFSSKFAHDAKQNCHEYILERNYTRGCRIPIKDHARKFKRIDIALHSEGNQTFSQVFHSLLRTVQLNPPLNLSLIWNEKTGTLFLYWNNSAPLTKNCIVYMVHNQKVPNQALNVTQTSYSLPRVSQNMPYVFQVRSTVTESCGSSDLWSDWSDPVAWSGTGSVHSIIGIHGLFALLAIILIFLLGLLLYYCDRKKIMIFPVVSGPSKSLQDLFHKHNGNVESWVQVSNELKEAFQPDYTEPSSDVCEVFDTTSKSEVSVPPKTEEELECQQIS